MTSYSLHHIAELLHAELVGDPACQITHMAPIESATAGAITFLLNAKYQRFVATTKASCLIVPSDFDGHFEGYLIKMSNPNLGYAKLASLFVTKPIRKSGIHATAVVGDNCEIADSVTIGAHVVLGDRVVIKDHALIGPGSVIGDDCYIGAETELAANVTLYHGIVVGDRVLIHSGAVLGADGFGMINDNGAWQKIPQLGSVRIGNDVEIGANTTIDRGAMDDTIIEDGVKLDNQIMIGHNVVVGAHTAMAGCTGVAGSTKIGKYCMIGGMTGISDHLNICDQAVFTGGSMVMQSIDKPGVYSSGLPAMPRLQWHRSIATIRKLNGWVSRLKKLEQRQHEQCQD